MLPNAVPQNFSFLPDDFRRHLMILIYITGSLLMPALPHFTYFTAFHFFLHNTFIVAITQYYRRCLHFHTFHYTRLKRYFADAIDFAAFED